MEDETESIAGEDDESRLIASELARSLAALTGGRDEALDRFSEVQVGLHSMLRQEAARQRARGREERARALEVRAGSSLAVITGLHAERHRLRIVVPDVSETQLLVHGRVQEPAGRGLPGLTVRLLDANNRPLPDVPAATTDESGYFALVLSPGERPDKQLRATLAVFSPKGRLLHRQREPVDIAPGGRRRLDVTLDPRDLVGKPEKPGYRPKPGRAAAAPPRPSPATKRKRRR